MINILLSYYIMVYDLFQLLVSLLYTGIVLLIIYILINKLEMLWTSYSFILLGLILSIYLFFKPFNLKVIIACFFLIFSISYNIYITSIYKNNISENKIPKSYYSLSISNIILICLLLYIVIISINLENKTFIINNSNFYIFLFLITLSFILNITEMIILKNFITDG